jgi:hypothetical protein
VIKDTGRIKVAEAIERIEEAEPVVEGEKYGGSWSTHWFFFEFELPFDWVFELHSPRK